MPAPNLQGTTVTATYGAGAEKLNGVVSWMLQDGQGSTRQLLNSSQAVTDSYLTDAYGNSLSSVGTTANPFKWNGGSGYYSDGESGLQKVGARYYDPTVGRFISQDTKIIAGSPAESQSLNRFNYCESDPIAKSDPTGHGTWTVEADSGREYSEDKIIYSWFEDPINGNPQYQHRVHQRWVQRWIDYVYTFDNGDTHVYHAFYSHWDYYEEVVNWRRRPDVG